MKIRVVVRLAMKEKQARLRGDRYANLIGELETAASLEMLLRQKNLDVSEKLRLVFRRKAPEDREIVFDDLSPVRGERLRLESLPATTGKQSEDNENVLPHCRPEWPGAMLRRCSVLFVSPRSDNGCQYKGYEIRRRE